MELNSNKLPSGAVMSPLAREVFRILERYTVFPWPILAAQCKRAGTDPLHLDTVRLAVLIPLLAAGVGRFTSPEKESAVKRELLGLATAPAPR
jgi:hypothetical protein